MSKVPNKVEDVLRHWDRGSRAQRISILSNFIKRHRTSTAAEIEQDFGHGAMLFFTRITAWLRLTYQLGQELSVQLSALSLFLQGQRFMVNFMEIGGIQTLTDVLCHVKGPNREQDKNSALLILIHVANSGRVYREMVCDGNGIDMLVNSTLDETTEKTLELVASLFMALGQGNPRKSALVHSGLLYVMLKGCEEGALCAATTLRSLQLAKQAYSVNNNTPLTMVGAESGTPESTEGLLSAFFHLLSVDSVKLRFEGTELLSIAAQNNMLIAPIVNRCLERLETQGIAHATHQEKHQLNVGREQAACGRILCNIILSNLTEESMDKLTRMLDRRSAHISLVKFLHLVDGRDVSAQVDCCRALKKLCLAEPTPQQSAGASSVGTGSRQVNLAEWIQTRVGGILFDEFLRAEQLSDEVAIAFSKKLLVEMEADTKRSQEADELEEERKQQLQEQNLAALTKRAGAGYGSSNEFEESEDNQDTAADESTRTDPFSPTLPEATSTTLAYTIAA